MDRVVKGIVIAVALGAAGGAAMGSMILPESAFSQRQAALAQRAAIADRPIAREVAYDPVTRRMSADYAAVRADCEGCSDFQLGYRYAERQGVAQTSDCEEYIWSYERGCLAYLRESRSGA